MSLCDQCYGDLKEDDTLRCKGGCNSSYHYKCCSITESNFKKLSAASRGKSVAGILSTLMAPIQAKLDGLQHMQQDISDLKKSMEFMSTQFDVFSSDVKDMKVAMSRLEKENVELKATVSTLQLKFDYIEQDSRRLNVEVHGVPETRNENLGQIVKDIADKLEAGVTVKNVFRAGPSRTDRSRKIVAVLGSEYERQEIVQKSRRNRILSADQLISNWPKAKIFVTENLTAIRADLLRLTKKKASENNIKFVWIKNFAIHARKGENEPVKVIRSVADLEKL